MKPRILRVGLMAGALAAGLLTSCAPSAGLDAIQPPGVRAVHRTGLPVKASVTGGMSQTALGGTGIRNEDFAHALEGALVESGMFRSAGGGGYQLDAFIVGMEQPIAGISMTVNLEVSYTLRKGGTTVWRKAIKSSYEAAFGESVIGVVRLKKATEGAARQNISELVRQLNARRP